MSKIPSIVALHQERNNKEQSKTEVFNVVLNKCIEKIIYTNRHTNQTFVIFEVPKLLIGHPFYDMKSCIRFLMHQLQIHRYIVEFVEPFYLYIDWGSNKTPNNCSDKLKQQTKHLLQKFPNTSRVEFVYADNPGTSKRETSTGTKATPKAKPRDKKK